VGWDLPIQLLGFDVRPFSEELDNDGASSDQFHLRKDLIRPLSTDTMVWGSALDIPEVEGAQPEWTGPFQDLWENLADVEEFVASQPSILALRSWVIAIGRIRCADAEAEFGPNEGVVFEYDGVVPSKVQPEWEFLGFDVSDYFQLSGLTNCGYTGEDQAESSQFGKGLNRYHLFTDFKIADKFRRFSDRRVEEHAPFFVHALFKIREIIPPNPS
jgi:hypothetical protein